MKILAVDVGKGTQDIMLFDSHQNMENSVKICFTFTDSYISFKNI